MAQYLLVNSNNVVTGYLTSNIKPTLNDGYVVEYDGVVQSHPYIIKWENNELVYTQEEKYAKGYAEKRYDEYPSIEEQLDMMYHHGYEGWRYMITRIKNKYPKS